MPLIIDGILFDTLSADPVSPAEGQLWYNTTSKLYKIYRNGQVSSFTDKAAFEAHTLDTNNPHATTLELARQAGDTFGGSINMGGNAINNVGQGSLSTDAAQRGWVTDQINSKVTGLDWQESVISQTDTPPGSPAANARYLVGESPTGAWSANANDVAVYEGGSWAFYTPNEGWTLRNEATNTILTFDGSSWGNIGNAVDHGALLGLGDDDHTQYLLASGTRAMGGSLDMGGNQITNVGNVDGVDISAHAARHLPGGDDPLTTSGTPETITDSTNAQGTTPSFALIDHKHAHGNLSGGSLHALSSASAAGFQGQSNWTATTNPSASDDSGAGYVVGSMWVNVSADTSYVCVDASSGAAVWKEITNAATLLANKAGKVAEASFSGSPKKATVTFTSPFANSNYAIQVSAITDGTGFTYLPNVESQDTTGFTISLGASRTDGLVSVAWTVTANGESA